MPALTVRISDDLHQKCKIMAAIKNMTMNNLYIHALKKMIAAENACALRKVKDLATTKDANDDEDGTD